MYIQYNVCIYIVICWNMYLDYSILRYIMLHYITLYYSLLFYIILCMYIYIYVGTCILISNSMWFGLHLKNLPNTLYPSQSCLLSFVFFLVLVLMSEDARCCSYWMQHFFCQIFQFPSTKLDDDYTYGWTTERVVVTILNCLTSWGGVGY